MIPKVNNIDSQLSSQRYGTNIVGIVSQKSFSYRGINFIHIGDIDRDGRPDIATASEVSGLAILINPKSSRKIGNWQIVQPNMGNAKDSWIRVKLADMNGDGQQEILAANRGNSKFSIFFVKGRVLDPDSFRETVIAITKSPINIRPVDIDNDGDLDVVISSRGTGSMKLCLNPGNARDWVTLPVYSNPKFSSEGFMMQFADFNGDGRLDIVTEINQHSKEGNGTLFWLEQPKALGIPWKPHTIGTIAPDTPAGLALLDINDDGRKDLFVGSYSHSRLRSTEKRIDFSEEFVSQRCGRLAWFEQPKDPKNQWKRHDISRRLHGMYDMFFPVDLNDDGHTDLITTRGNSGIYDGAIWLEQVRTREKARAFVPARDELTPAVPLPKSISVVLPGSLR